MSNTRVKMHPTLGILICTDGHVMMPTTNKYGNPRWTLGTTGAHGGYLRARIQGKDYRVHHLVLETFVGMCPPGMQCDHINRNRTDNRLENLRWVTPKENSRNRKDNDRCEALLGMHWYQDAHECYKRYCTTEQGKATIKRCNDRAKNRRKSVLFSNGHKTSVLMEDYYKLIQMAKSERDMDKFKKGTLFATKQPSEILKLF